MSTSKGPAWGWPQKLKFTLGYAADKLTIFNQVKKPRWAFWAYELRYSLSNAYHTVAGGQGRAIWRKSDLIETLRGTFQVRPNSQDASLISPAFERQDVDFLLKRLKRAAAHGPVVFLDIGANLGRYTVTVGKTIPEVKIWAFEPDPENFKLLQSNFLLNNLSLPQVQLFSVALGEAPAQMDLYGHPLRGGDNSLQAAEGLTKITRVAVKPLKPWLDQLPPEATVFLKLDVEGFEPAVLKGAGDLRGRFRGVEILVEDIHQREKLYGILHEMGALPELKLTPYNSWWRI